MRVTRLEIFGFKSFVDRFVLNFDKNMIGIIGPNGCGKSNVVDSLRWVLGETHAKHLRGGSFDDLIFNGSDSRRQLGMAEVSLTIRPEVEWRARIENGGNKEDIDQDLLELGNLDESLSQSILEAEKIDVIITNNDENSVQFESNESVKKEETDSISSPLDLVSNKVISIPGLFDASEIQFTRRLYRSGESEYFINKVPCRLRDMQDLYRLIGLGARGLSIVQQGHIGQFISRKPVERRELLEEAAGISGFRTKMEAASRRLEKTDENLSRISDILLEVEKQLKVLRRQSARAKARQSLKDELTNSEHQLFKIKAVGLKNKIETSEAEINSYEQEIAALKAKISDNDSSILNLDAHLHEINVNLLALRREKDEHSRLMLEEENQIQETKIQLTRLESNEVHLKQNEEDDNRRIVSIDQELETLLNEKTNKFSLREDVQRELDSSKAQLEELETKNAEEIRLFQEVISSSENNNPELAKVAEELLTLTAKVELLEGKLLDLKNLEQSKYSKEKEKREIEIKLRSEEKNLEKLKSESAAIEKQLNSLATHAVSATSSENLNSESGGSSNYRVFLSLLTIPEELEKAVHAVLGEKANFLVSDDSFSRLQSYFDKHGKSARIGVIDENSKTGASQANELVESFEGIQKLVSEISFNESDKNIVEELIGNVWIANDLSSAKIYKLHLDSINAKNYTIVLRTGEVLTPWGWYTTEGEGLHFSFTRRKAELLVEEHKYEETCSQIRNELSDKELDLTSTTAELELLYKDRSELADNQRKVSNLLKLQGQEEKKYYQELREKEHNLRQRLRDSERECSSKVTEVERKCATLSSDISNIDHRINKANSERERILETLQSYQERYSSIQDQKNEILRVVSEVNEAIGSEESQNRKLRIQELETIIESEENIRLSRHQELAEFKIELSNLRKQIEDFDRKLRTFESQRDRSTIELEMLNQDFNRYYPEISIDDLPSVDGLDAGPDQLQSLIKELNETSTTLRKKLEREGEVDPQSIELCETEEARYESMSTQSKDLNLAKETLEKTIKQLKELSRIRFLETFMAVNTKFKELIPRLFSGGSGHLELLNPEDPLQSGVEIVVRPPGKKITTMELMSGGEKALVAIAVLVAMFLHHPGPICVLDEIDAPLDDANLVKLLDLLKEISDKTQFLVITHNKITMQAVDRLIGITMQESGVTTALSVTLDEAEKQIDQMMANA